MNAKAGQLTVTRQFTKSGERVGEDADEEVLDVAQFPEGVKPAEIDYRQGITVNMGNFESVRVDVGVKYPCFAEEADEAFVFVKRFVESRISNELASLRDARKQRGNK